MSEDFSKISTAARFRKVMRRLVQTEVDRIYPPDAFGVVVRVDESARTADVGFPGNDVPQAVSYGFGAPPTEGAQVRVSGRAGQRYIITGGGGSGGGTGGTGDAPSKVESWNANGIVPGDALTPVSRISAADTITSMAFSVPIDGLPPTGRNLIVDLLLNGNSISGGQVIALSSTDAASVVRDLPAPIVTVIGDRLQGHIIDGGGCYDLTWDVIR